jgi:hypothetical protein
MTAFANERHLHKFWKAEEKEAIVLWKQFCPAVWEDVTHRCFLEALDNYSLAVRLQWLRGISQ